LVPKEIGFLTFIKPHLAAVFLAASLSFPVVAQEAPTAEKVLATVDGTDITLGHVISVQENLPAEYKGLPDDQLLKGILDQLIQQAALAGTLGDDLSTRMVLGVEIERRAYLSNMVLLSAARSAATEEAIKAAYDARYANAEPEAEYNASHILVATEEEAKALVEELAGGADFAELAKAKSIGPSGPNGGSLGWFGKGMMVPEFENAVITLEPDTVSVPVQTQFGWHVIKLNESRNKAAPALEEVRQELSTEIEQAAIKGFVEAVNTDTQIDRMEVDFDPAAIRDSSLID